MESSSNRDAYPDPFESRSAISFEKAIDLLTYSHLEGRIANISSKSLQYALIYMCVRMVQSLVIMKKWYYCRYEDFTPEMLEVYDDFVKTLDGNITDYFRDVLRNQKTIQDIYDQVREVEKKMKL